MGRCLEVIEVIVVIARDKKEAALEFLVPFFLGVQLLYAVFELGRL